MVEVTACQTGCKRYHEAEQRVLEVGGTWSTLECFDKCSQCELALLARIDGAMMRFRGIDDLIEAVVTLGGE